jgi:two-component system cell cycle sensor histidine kinase/response regulator CckA
MSRVLVVDDEKSIRLTLAAFLSAEGYEVSTASGYDDALGFVKSNKIDLIVSDIVLNGKSGLDLLETIKDKSSELPVILITGQPSLDSAQRGLRYGAFDYIQKPVLKEPFLAITKRALFARAQQKRKRQREDLNLRYREKLEQRVIAQSIDIRKVVRALNKSEERYKTLVTTLPEIIVELDFDLNFLWSNGVGIDFFGADLAGRNLTQHFADPSDIEHFKRECEKLTKDTVYLKLMLRRTDGTERLLSWTFRRLEDNEPALSYILATARDITDIRTLEDQLRQAGKLETLGQLAGGVAHDINNIMSAILAQANLLRVEQDQERLSAEDVKNAALFIERAVSRAEALTSKLLGFARKGKRENSALDLNIIINDALEILERTLEKSIILKLELNANKQIVIGDSTQLHQVILNLALNARDAMTMSAVPESGQHRGGKLLIRSSNVEIGADYSNPESRVGSFIRIDVQDSGPGIPERILKRIFEPFFTTKGPDKGSGLGLSMVYGIVKGHAGFIEVDSREGQGSCFSVFLPVAEQQEVFTPTRDDSKIELKSANGKILVIDDDELIRSSLSSLLNFIGYDVISAADGSAALELLQRENTDLKGVLLDLSLPGMTSLECFTALKAIDPKLRIIICSGYGLNPQVQELLNHGASEMLQKPFTVNQLAEALADIEPES